jgi:methanogenic corrinoid protein MtbC1
MTDVELRAALLDALLRRRQPEALRLVREAAATSLRFAFEDVVRPVLERIGSLWSKDRISVADEHAATAIAQVAVSALYADFPWPEAGPRAIVACVEGERHQFGARMLADLLSLDGWNVTFLGADTPTASLARMVAAERPLFVALSVTLPHHLEAARTAVAAVRGASAEVRILAGGRGLSGQQEAARALGVDVALDRASAAVEMVRSWRS